MKRFYFALTIISFFCVSAFAQTSQSAPCPNISVLGPPEIIYPGEAATFTVTINNEISVNYFYKWTVTGGNIIEENGELKSGLENSVEGKGKTVVKTFQPPEAVGKSLTATVEVNGLPENCPNTSSESMSIIIDPAALLLDEFSISPKKIDELKLNNLVTEAKNSPHAQIYIIEKFEEKTSSKTMKLKNQKTIAYLKAQGIERNRITLLNALDNENQTRFFIVPSGATAPDCDDCVTVETM